MLHRTLKSIQNVNLILISYKHDKSEIDVPVGLVPTQVERYGPVYGAVLVCPRRRHIFTVYGP